MASGISNYLTQKLLSKLFASSAFTFPSMWMVLYSASPSDSTAGTEASGGGYARVSFAVDGTVFPSISSGNSVTNSGAAITFAVGTGTGYSAGVNMVSASMMDASSSGNLLFWGDLTTPKPVLLGDTPSFATSAITVAMS